MSEPTEVRSEREAPENEEVWVMGNGRPYLYYWNSLGSRRTFPGRAS